MTLDQTDLIVSIFNLILEKKGYEVGEVGFGYDSNLTISCPEMDLTEALQWTFDELKTLKE